MKHRITEAELLDAIRQAAYAEPKREPGTVRTQELAEQLNMDPRRILTALGQLQDRGLVEPCAVWHKDRGGRVRRVTGYRFLNGKEI